MKLSTKILAIAIILLLILSFWSGWYLKPKPPIPDNRKEKAQTQHTIDSLKNVNFNLEKENGLLIDSLKKKKEYIVNINPKEHQGEIDLAIKKDSVSSIHLFRIQLSTLDYDTSSSKLLTYAEIGTGAKELSTIPGLRLKVKNYSDMSNTYDQLLQIKDRQIENLKQTNYSQLHLLDLTKQNVDTYKSAYESTQSIFYQFPLKTFIFVVGFIIGFLAVGAIK